MSLYLNQETASSLDGEFEHALFAQCLDLLTEVIGVQVLHWVRVEIVIILRNSNNQTLTLNPLTLFHDTLLSIQHESRQASYAGH